MHICYNPSAIIYINRSYKVNTTVGVYIGSNIIYGHVTKDVWNTQEENLIYFSKFIYPHNNGTERERKTLVDRSFRRRSSDFHLFF